MRLAFGLEKAIGPYLSAHFPELMLTGEYEPHLAVAFVDDDDRLFGAVGMRYLSHFEAELSIYTEHPGFLTRTVLRELFGIAFSRVVRLSCTVNRRNMKARRFVERIGFRLEGMKRKGFDGKRDAALYAMTADDCRWIRE